MKHFSYAGFRHKKQCCALTGITPDVFQTMIGRLRPHWRERIVAAKKRSGRPWHVGELEDHLLVLLLLDHFAVTQDFVACLYGTDQSVISRAPRRSEKLAARVLGVKCAIPVSPRKQRHPSSTAPSSRSNDPAQATLLVFRQEKTPHYQDLRHAIGNRHDQGRLGRGLPLTARRPAETGRALPE